MRRRRSSTSSSTGTRSRRPRACSRFRPEAGPADAGSRRGAPIWPDGCYQPEPDRRRPNGTLRIIESRSHNRTCGGNIEPASRSEEHAQTTHRTRPGQFITVAPRPPARPGTAYVESNTGRPGPASRVAPTPPGRIIERTPSQTCPAGPPARQSSGPLGFLSTTSRPPARPTPIEGQPRQQQAPPGVWRRETVRQPLLVEQAGRGLQRGPGTFKTSLSRFPSDTAHAPTSSRFRETIRTTSRPQASRTSSRSEHQQSPPIKAGTDLVEQVQSAASAVSTTVTGRPASQPGSGRCRKVARGLVAVHHHPERTGPSQQVISSSATPARTEPPSGSPGN